MKKIMIYVLMAVLSLPALAQNTNTFFEQLTNQYSDQDGFSASMITSDMFDLYIKKKNIDEESAVYEALNDLDKIMVVSQSNLNSNFVPFVAGEKQEKEEKSSLSNDLYEMILNHYQSGGYTLLKTEKRMGEEVKVYLKKNQDIIKSLAVLTNSSVNTNLVELEGDINLTAVADLNKALNLRGLENLYKINNNSSAAVYLGQNATYFSPERVEEMAARQKEMIERQQLFSDEQREKLEEQARIQAEKQREMIERYREMAERYQRQPIFLNYPGDSTIYYLNGEKVEADKIKELDKENIKSIEVNKSEKEGDKTTITIKTK